MHSKLIVVGVGAFTFGAFISWALTADYFDRKMRSNQLLLGEIISRQDKELSDFYAEQIQASMFDPPDWESPSEEAVQAEAQRVADNIEADSENSPEETSDETGNVISETAEETRTNLQNLIDSYTADSDDVDTFVSRAGATLEYDGTPPYVISRELYASDPDEGDNYAKITITYYPRVRTLVDDDEDVIDDVDNYVGWRNLSQFGYESGDGDTVFIRNRRLLTDFEVVREEDEDPPIHITYGMSREEFRTNKAAGVLKFRDEDSD